jgi:hypothetical protein
LTLLIVPLFLAGRAKTELARKLVLEHRNRTAKSIAK